jgi:deoxyribodipyrimidine photo-lyase
MSKEKALDLNLNEITKLLKLNSESESSQAASPKLAKKSRAPKKHVKETGSQSETQPSLERFLGDKQKPRKKDDDKEMKLIDVIAKKRTSLFKTVLDFSFNKKRVRILSKNEDVPDAPGGVLYWMSREQRVQDNWSLLFAQRLALKQNIPLHVCFNLVPKFQDATIRHFYFMLEGLKEVEQVLTGFFNLIKF